MARQKTAGRTTAKERPDSGSRRYTPPAPRSKRHSARWVPVAMFTFLPGGEAQNSDLILGLGLLVGGFVMSTQYR